MDESALVSGCIKGDNRFRKQLYEMYAQQMMAVCFRYAGDRKKAEDILHDGFIKVFESIQSFQYRGKGSLRAWMTKVFANLALQQLREQALWETLPFENMEDLDVETEEVESIPDDVLLNFVSELPPGYRAVFNQYIFEGKSHKEIARVLGINESSSRSQLTRARAILVDRIKGYMQQYG